MKRKKAVIGNWKMEMGLEEGERFLESLLPQLKGETLFVGIAPSYVALARAAEQSGSAPLHIGGQNMSQWEKGAYTGEVSCAMLRECGATFVLVGHSERRQLFGEGDAAVGEKVERALEGGVPPLLCIGETEAEREAGQVEETLQRQLEGGMGRLSAREVERVMIAYEPVWAIGSGRSATPEMAQECHHLVRAFIAKKWGEVAEKVSLLYGGSVKVENAGALLQQRDVDGLLVGGASLKVDTFKQLIELGEEAI